MKAGPKNKTPPILVLKWGCLAIYSKVYLQRNVYPNF